MNGPTRTFLLLLAGAAATACNDGGALGVTAAAPSAPSASANASAGGIWHGLDATDESLSLMVAETGELKAFATGPAFGSGAVVVTDGNRVAGSFDARALGKDVSNEDASVPFEHCEFEGSIVERIAMHVDVTCATAAGEGRTRSRTLLFDPHYLSGSSLEDVAGNYTLPFAALANTLTIGNDGSVFGIYDNGPRCTVNGTVQPVDSRFNLYRFEWQLAGCAAPHARLEGAELAGLGFLDPPGRPPGTLLVLLTGTVEGRFEFLSLVYEPV